MRSLVPEYIEKLVPYKPGKPIAQVQKELGLRDVIKLASNENPFGPSPKAVEKLRESLGELHRYPDIGTPVLREHLAQRFGLEVENVIVGSGSEGIMANVIRTFLDDQEEVLTSEGTFVGIYVLTNSRGVKLRTIPLNNYRFDLPAIARAISPATKIIYLANPNNPTGSYFTQKEFEEFHARVPTHTLIILDEAYFEFAAEFSDYPDSLQYRYDNVITLRTFSKAYGLAGLRIGYGFAAPALIGNLLKVKLPFEPSIPAAAAGIGALEDREFLEMVLANNSAQRTVLVEFFSSLGYRVLPSATNFITLVLAGYDQVEHLSNFMLHNGIILRPLNAFGLPHCLRITVGTKEENARLMQAMRAYHN